jgi:hypothetical protein
MADIQPSAEAVAAGASATVVDKQICLREYSAGAPDCNL